MKLSLTREERQVLLRKYIKQGLTFEEARDKVNSIVFHLKGVVKKLREKKKSKEYIKKKFLEEFERICMQEEYL